MGSDYRYNRRKRYDYMLTKGYTEQILRKFKNEVVKQSRTKLTKGKKNFSKELYNSIQGKVDTGKNWISISFSMEEYGIFQDKGVKGVKSNYPENRDSPFSYKSSSNLIGLEGATGNLGKWAKHKRLRWRNQKTGRYLSYKSIGFILANSIKNKGLKASLFFTKPFENEYNKLDEELIEAFGLDLKDFLDLALKNGK